MPFLCCLFLFYCLVFIITFSFADVWHLALFCCFSSADIAYSFLKNFILLSLTPLLHYTDMNLKIPLFFPLPNHNSFYNITVLYLLGPPHVKALSIKCVCGQAFALFQLTARIFSVCLSQLDTHCKRDPYFHCSFLVSCCFMGVSFSVCLHLSWPEPQRHVVHGWMRSSGLRQWSWGFVCRLLQWLLLFFSPKGDAGCAWADHQDSGQQTHISGAL